MGKPPAHSRPAPCYSMPGSKRLPGDGRSRKHPSRRAPSDHMHLSEREDRITGSWACSEQLGGGASMPPKLNLEPQGFECPSPPDTCSPWPHGPWQWEWGVCWRLP